MSDGASMCGSWQASCFLSHLWKPIKLGVRVKLAAALNVFLFIFGSETSPKSLPLVTQDLRHSLRVTHRYIKTWVWLWWPFVAVREHRLFHALWWKPTSEWSQTCFPLSSHQTGKLPDTSYPKLLCSGVFYAGTLEVHQILLHPLVYLSTPRHPKSSGKRKKVFYIIERCLVKR